MKPDLDRYLPYIEDIEMSDKQKQELLASLWTVMQVFVDLGFGVDATQNAIFAKQISAGKESADSLRFKFNQKAQVKKNTKKKGVRYEP